MIFKESRNINAEYKPAEQSFWEGRKSNPDISNQYWHQEITLFDANISADYTNIDAAILGYVCDEGVRRNRGRIGADKGARNVRESLAKLPIHFEEKRVIDYGDIVCVNNNMEACQELFAISISKLINQKILPIAIGGGHDMAYGHFKGIYNSIKDSSNCKIGIINFDAHFDLRPVEKQSNSGTPFHQILTEFNKDKKVVDYFAIGIQQQSNTKELFKIAKEQKVEYAINYDCESSFGEINALKKRLSVFIEHNDYLYLTIDMDGFSSAYAPGVSAPSPLGFTPYFVFKILDYLLATKKVISIDLAELNPLLDKDNITSNLAARIVDYIITKH